MARFTITNGEARAVAASLLPHAGRESKDTPNLGRIRFAREVERLHAWTSDYLTNAHAAAVIVENLDGDLGTWDLATEHVRAFLAVFKAPGDPDLRQMWEDSELRVVVDDETVTFEEVTGLVEGRSLTVPLEPQVGEDTFPDVPRLLVDALDDPASTISGAALRSSRLAPFIPSAKAWGESMSVHLTHGEYPHLIVLAGGGFIGSCSTRLLSDKDRQERRTAHLTWRDTLAPLRRPEPPAEQSEAEAFAAAIRQAATDPNVTVTVTAAPGGTDA